MGTFHDYVIKHDIIPSGIILTNLKKYDHYICSMRQEILEIQTPVEHESIIEYTNTFANLKTSESDVLESLFSANTPNLHLLFNWLDECTIKVDAPAGSSGGAKSKLDLSLCKPKIIFHGELCNDQVPIFESKPFNNGCFSIKTDFPADFWSNQTSTKRMKSHWPFQPVADSLCPPEILKSILPKTLLSPFCSTAVCQENFGYNPKAISIITDKNDTIGLFRGNILNKILCNQIELILIMRSARLFTANILVNAIIPTSQEPINRETAKTLFEILSSQY